MVSRGIRWLRLEWLLLPLPKNTHFCICEMTHAKQDSQTSLMETLSSVAPDWLSFSVDENNNLFDIQNIAASLVSNLEHCSGFPLNSASSFVYYRPTMNYKIWVAQSDVYLCADGTTCFASNISNPGLLVSLSIGQANILKSSLNIFQDMQDKGLSLHVDSIGLHKDRETARFVNEFTWYG